MAKTRFGANVRDRTLGDALKDLTRDHNPREGRKMRAPRKGRKVRTRSTARRRR